MKKLAFLLISLFVIILNVNAQSENIYGNIDFDSVIGITDETLYWQKMDSIYKKIQELNFENYHRKGDFYDIDIEKEADSLYLGAKKRALEMFSETGCPEDSSMVWLNADIERYDAKKSKTIKEIQKVYENEVDYCYKSYCASDVFITIRILNEDAVKDAGEAGRLEINYMGLDNKIHCIDICDVFQQANCSFVTINGDKYSIKTSFNYIIISKNDQSILKAQKVATFLLYFKGTKIDLWK